MYHQLKTKRREKVEDGQYKIKDMPEKRLAATIIVDSAAWEKTAKEQDGIGCGTM